VGPQCLLLLCDQYTDHLSTRKQQFRLWRSKRLTTITIIIWGLPSILFHLLLRTLSTVQHHFSVHRHQHHPTSPFLPHPAPHRHLFLAVHLCAEVLPAITHSRIIGKEPFTDERRRHTTASHTVSQSSPPNIGSQLNPSHPLPTPNANGRSIIFSNRRENRGRRDFRFATCHATRGTLLSRETSVSSVDATFVDAEPARD
jgi:hypothetical protein